MDKKSYDNGPDLSFVEQKVREVQSTIENAVKTSNYQELNQSITRMVNNTLKQYQKEHPESVRGGKKQGQPPEVQRVQETHPELYGNTGGEKVKDILLVVFGGILSGSMAMGLLTVQILQAVTGHGGISSTAVTLIGTLAGLGMVGGGCKGLGRLKRFKKYVKALGDRTYCDFEHLAGAVGRNVKFVKKDIHYMIQKGWFLEGKTDQKETCLITSTETYRQYAQTQEALEQRTEEEQRKHQQESEKHNRISPEVQEVLDKGEAYIQKIHASNDAIPGEEISAKIAKMEQIVDQIFQRAEEHPEIIPDLKRMMDYYLPMTVKLLDAYEDMDSQPIQGETIRASKKEIEDTLDTLNDAFARLLDSVFQDTAWDVSSDISVLHTMLAQEGLTGSDFSKK
ncbi:5-bromo-4-chloroindolyl phosphate hydrolysis family protein [Blautia sp. MSJ-19]|uniref:5-bromo-4-chloroindolyl phosphate hydrolysis family protein n=1 Tax=Blautia sp. MSJ-19 TaxID=2841517 RepID=UPI00209E786F|nr:5-bromo-4-chloroindolyl phosphate hydrolysis family protein [Blautia sp. MSJ-19]